MNNKEIVNYARNMILTNLYHYIDTNQNNILEIAKIINDDDDKYLLEHLKGVKGLIEKAIEIIERRKRK